MAISKFHRQLLGVLLIAALGFVIIILLVFHRFYEEAPPNMLVYFGVLPDTVLAVELPELPESQPPNCVQLVGEIGTEWEKCGEDAEALIALLNSSDKALGYNLLSTAYSLEHQSGSQLYFVATSPASCYNSSFGVSSLNPEWDNKISSIATNSGAGCIETKGYEFANYGGANVSCSLICYVLNVMNNKISSLKIR